MVKRRLNSGIVTSVTLRQPRVASRFAILNTGVNRTHNLRRIFQLVAIVCLLLTVTSSFAAVLHVHSTPAESLNCQVCVLAHSTAPAAIQTAARPTFFRVADILLPELRTRQRLIVFALSVRPPPLV